MSGRLEKNTFDTLKGLIRSLLDHLFYYLFPRIRARLAYFIFGIEGVNRILLSSESLTNIAILRKYGAEIGEGCRIYSPLIIVNAVKGYKNLYIRSNTHIGKGCLIDLRNKVNIGERVTISMKSNIITHLDVGNSALKDKFPVSEGQVEIGNNCYLGIGTTVLHGVKIGQGAFVSAHSLVKDDIAYWTLVAGTPAKLIRRLDNPQIE